MIEDTKSPEEIAQSISAAFDSVGLIDRIIQGQDMTQASDEERKSTVERNMGHLKIMMEKDWFVSGSTSTQRSKINKSITSGSAYIA
jgi:hypothetical protein